MRVFIIWYKSFILNDNPQGETRNLEIHISNIKKDMTIIFIELHRLSESLNSRVESWQKSSSQSRINNYSQGIKEKLQLGEKRGERRGVKEMVSMKLQKRLAANVLKCGREKVWLHPNEVNKEFNEISMTNNSQNIIKVVKDGFVIKKSTKIHSRSHVG